MKIHNALLVCNGSINRGWVEWSDGRIVSSGFGEIPDATDSLDAEGAYLIPGLVDSHVHFRDPGLTHKGDYMTESLAAAAGGVTTAFDMPNTVPATTSAEELAAKVARIASNGAYCRIVPMLGAKDDAVDQLRKIDLSATPCVKLFLGTTTGAMGAPEGKNLEDLFRFCADMRLPIMVHAEDNAIIDSNMKREADYFGGVDKIPFDRHRRIRSREACRKSTAGAVELAERFGTRLHIAHVSTAEEVKDFLTEGPTAGKLITAETTPLYLDPIIAVPSTRDRRLKVNPAIKEEYDAEALRAALFTGAIDTIGTDHAPHLLEEKLLPGLTAASGAPSIQFALPAMLTYLPVEKVVEKMTAGPRDVFGLQCNTDFSAGSNADFALVRETESYTVVDTDVLSRCAWTPFAGRTFRHRVVSTWVGGVQVWGGNEPRLFSHASDVKFCR
ncbi:MAG: amidohydrolase family protein [Bacteroidales bacterium]|nr:amidohydrolase family protein [Bacteroidales bacterium]